ncbi:MAG: phytochelatin synthase family protein [Bdellovibrionota bacterium]
MKATWMKKALVGSMIVMAVACAKPSLNYFQSDAQLISFSSELGRQMFDESHTKADFFSLANQFESQNNKIFCGPTSAAIVLNTLFEDDLRTNRVAVSPDVQPLLNTDSKYLGKKDELKGIVFNRYTQNNVFLPREASSSIKTRMQVWGGPIPGQEKADWGFQLKQLDELFKAQGATSTAIVVADDANLNEAKSKIIAALADTQSYVVVNYSRKAMGQEGGGHISPIGAYHEPSDSFLVMDVNPNKAGWVWAKASTLMAAMKTFDTVENRGFLIVSR